MTGKIDTSLIDSMIDTKHIRNEIDFNLEKSGIKPSKDEGIIFNIIKYSVALSPIVIPFLILYYLTSYNIILAILGTFIFDMMLIIIMTMIYFKYMMGDVKE